MSKIDPRDYADLIQRPLLTEKATRMMELNQFTFDVAPQPPQHPTKAATEEQFKVKVIGVNPQTPPRKKRRVGKFVGFKPSYKRATVTLTDGDSIRKLLFPEV